jgi:multicomponent Na+:H+ antiporter subunit D
MRGVLGSEARSAGVRALAVGVVPAFAAAVGRAGEDFTDHAGYLDAVLGGRSAPPRPAPPPEWTAAGVALDLFSTALAAGCAALAVWRPVHTGAARAWVPVRRMQSGHIGDYVAWVLAGVALLAALAAYGTVT